MSDTGRRIKSATLEDGERLDFSYDEHGRVTAMTHHEGSNSYSMRYTYSSTHIVATLYGNDTTDIGYRTVYTLTDGLITLATDYDEEGNAKGEMNYQYQDRYLANSFNRSLHWENNNLTEIVLDDPESPFLDDHYTFTYSDISTNSKLDLYLTNYADFALVMQGYFGNGTQHRLSRMDYADTAIMYGELITSAFSADYTYTYDGYGDVASVLATSEGNTAPSIILLDWE